ncbi:MAG: cyclase, partial [Ruminococcaceae bacterium]|nr:cyclase [Oscillospiraceae bacterium]
SHFVKDGKTIDEIPLEIFVGECFVARHEGDVTAEDAETILKKAEAVGADERILIAGDATVTAEAARVFVSSGNIKLLGNESQCVGPKESPMEVHVILLEAGIILLEGVVLKDVYEGKYLLNAAPINLVGLEGAPCRAYLIGI